MLKNVVSASWNKPISVTCSSLDESLLSKLQIFHSDSCSEIMRLVLQDLEVYWRKTNTNKSLTEHNYIVYKNQSVTSDEVPSWIIGLNYARTCVHTKRVFQQFVLNDKSHNHNDELAAGFSYIYVPVYLMLHKCFKCVEK